jgi:hypothetical protein
MIHSKFVYKKTPHFLSFKETVRMGYFLLCVPSYVPSCFALVDCDMLLFIKTKVVMFYKIKGNTFLWRE